MSYLPKLIYLYLGYNQIAITGNIHTRIKLIFSLIFTIIHHPLFLTFVKIAKFNEHFLNNDISEILQCSIRISLFHQFVNICIDYMFTLNCLTFTNSIQNFLQT